jgi:hypothetical protein
MTFRSCYNVPAAASCQVVSHTRALCVNFPYLRSTHTAKQDNIHEHAFYRTAAKLAVQAYVAIHDNPEVSSEVSCTLRFLYQKNWFWYR